MPQALLALPQCLSQRQRAILPDVDPGEVQAAKRVVAVQRTSQRLRAVVTNGGAPQVQPAELRANQCEWRGQANYQDQGLGRCLGQAYRGLHMPPLPPGRTTLTAFAGQHGMPGCPPPGMAWPPPQTHTSLT